MYAIMLAARGWNKVRREVARRSREQIEDNLTNGGSSPDPLHRVENSATRSEESGKNPSLHDHEHKRCVASDPFLKALIVFLREELEKAEKAFCPDRCNQ